MTKWEKFLAFVFSFNVLLGVIAFGYFLSFFTGLIWAIIITQWIYFPLVVFGIEPATRKDSRTQRGEFYAKDDEE